MIVMMKLFFTFSIFCALVFVNPVELFAQGASPGGTNAAEIVDLLGGDIEELLRLLEGGGGAPAPLPGAAGGAPALLPGMGGDATQLDWIEQMIREQNPLTLSYSPRNPDPGETVTVRVEMGGRHAPSSLVNWYVDGELFSSGAGAQSISFRVREVGEVSTIYAEVVPRVGTPERTLPLVIGASYIDMLWEAFNAETPPFYKGKALPSWDSIVRVHVIPRVYSATGTRIEPGTFIYTWEKNARRADLNNQSGYGRDSVFVPADFTRRTHRVTVFLANDATGVSTIGSVEIRLHDPEILLYEKHPLGGVIFERALSSSVTHPADGSVLRIVAYPFGMSVRNRESIGFTWSVNGRRLDNTAAMNRGEIFLAPEGAGSSRLQIRVRNEEEPLQLDEKTINVVVQ
jgi:hypothetical protein